MQGSSLCCEPLFLLRAQSPEPKACPTPVEPGTSLPSRLVAVKAPWPPVLSSSVGPRAGLGDSAPYAAATVTPPGSVSLSIKEAAGVTARSWAPASPDARPIIIGVSPRRVHRAQEHAGTDVSPGPGRRASHRAGGRGMRPRAAPALSITTGHTPGARHAETIGAGLFQGMPRIQHGYFREPPGPGSGGRGLLADLVTAMCGDSTCHRFCPVTSWGGQPTART